MNYSETRNLIAALDIGTSRIIVLVGEIKPDGILKVIGVGTNKSSGVKNSMVVDIDAAAHAIQCALVEAELMANCKIREVYGGISGSHIRSSNSIGMIKLAGNEVSQADIDRVLETASSFGLPGDQSFLHILEQEFTIDGQEGIKKPLGMKGMRLEVAAHIVTGAVAETHNINECAQRCGLEVNEMILQSLASGKAVLTDDEKNFGVCLLDIGSGTTKAEIFVNGSIRYTAVLQFGADLITADIAMALHTTIMDAEKLKVKYGCAMRQLVEDTAIDMPATAEYGERVISRQILAGIIESRVRELYSIVRKELRRQYCDDLTKFSVVVTGGGSVMPGMVELGENVFRMPVRLGVPCHVGGLHELVGNPGFSTVVGLLLYGMDRVSQNSLVE